MYIKITQNTVGPHPIINSQTCKKIYKKKQIITCNIYIQNKVTLLLCLLNYFTADLAAHVVSLKISEI